MHHPDFIGHRENFGKFTQEVEEQVRRRRVAKKAPHNDC